MMMFLMIFPFYIPVGELPVIVLGGQVIDCDDMVCERGETNSFEHVSTYDVIQSITATGSHPRYCVDYRL